MEEKNFVFDLNGGKIFYLPRKLLGWGLFSWNRLVNSWESSDHHATTRILKVIHIGSIPGKTDTENGTSVVHSFCQKLLTLSHPNVVQHFGTAIDVQDGGPSQRLFTAGNVALLIENCSGGALYRLCQDKRAIPHSIIHAYTLQILHGLNYLHRNGIIHYDLTARNVLLSGDFTTLKIGGFYVINGRNERSETKSLHQRIFPGGMEFMSPELYLATENQTPNSTITEKTDIWSLGCIILFMLAGRKLPFGDWNHPHRLTKYLSCPAELNPLGGWNDIIKYFQLPENVPDNLMMTLSCCFRLNPNDRSSAQGLLDLRWEASEIDQLPKLITEWNPSWRRPLQPDISEKEQEFGGPCPAYTLTEILSTSGGQGIVYMAVRDSQGEQEQEPIVIKKEVFPMEYAERRKRMLIRQSQMEALVKVIHPNIARHFYAKFSPQVNAIEPPTFITIMEFCAGGSLRKAAKRQICLPQIQRITKLVLNGLTFVHENLMIHGDLKGENIVLTSHNLDTCEIKVIDFGLAQVLRRDATATGEINLLGGTFGFMAPEVTDNDLKTGRKSDIFGFGGVVMEMLTGHSPGQLDCLPDGLPKDIIQFIGRCRDPNPELRPSAKELLQLPFLTAGPETVAEWSFHDHRPKPSSSVK